MKTEKQKLRSKDKSGLKAVLTESQRQHVPKIRPLTEADLRCRIMPRSN